MARIRTIKPELFVSESLAAVSLTAERTFLGLLTQADDLGRHRDHPAIIAGQLWPLRPQHTALDVEEDLAQLEAAGVICRYTGCDGRGYLHMVNWRKHQKIDRPSASRVPRCPEHQLHQRCGECKDTCGHHEPPVENPPLVDASKARRGLASPTNTTEVTAGPDAAAAAPDTGTTDRAKHPTSRRHNESAGQGTFVEASRGSHEDSAPGSRILDPGSLPMGREAPLPPTGSGQVTAKTLVGEYVAGCAHRPPERVLGHLGREIRSLLDEGFTPEPVRAGLERLRIKGLSPGTLPALVNESLNAGGSAGGYTPWMNPSDEAYEEAL